MSVELDHCKQLATERSKYTRFAFRYNEHDSVIASMLSPVTVL